jgi:hypothetical protein
MNIRLMISAAGSADGHAVASLYRWLSRDNALARHGQVSMQAVSQQSDDMGAVLDVINAIFTDTGAMAGIGSLLVAYRTWRDTQTKAPSLVIEKDGVSVVINRGSEEEIQQVLDLMLPTIDTADTQPSKP